MAKRVLHRGHREISGGTPFVVQTRDALHFAQRLPFGFLVRSIKNSRMYLLMRLNFGICSCFFRFCKRFMESPLGLKNERPARV
jgi:hypothetical protein